MQFAFDQAIEQLVANSNRDWLSKASHRLRELPPSALKEDAVDCLPKTNNADLATVAADVIERASKVMSWNSLGWVLQTAGAGYLKWRTETQVELLWSGPSPSARLRARRIDQVLYDKIALAKSHILLVTFAAAKIERLAGELLKATKRGVNVRLVLEFSKPSEGQLTSNALRAFPLELASAVKVYYWPLEKRERNQAGRPGKLHAKFAVVDEVAIISSANLTDDAFNRNLEIGALITSSQFLTTLNDYVDGLIQKGILNRLEL